LGPIAPMISAVNLSTTSLRAINLLFLELNDITG